jgi:hypothetical protein
MNKFTTSVFVVFLLLIANFVYVLKSDIELSKDKKNEKKIILEYENYSPLKLKNNKINIKKDNYSILLFSNCYVC